MTWQALLVQKNIVINIPFECEPKEECVSDKLCSTHGVIIRLSWIGLPAFTTPTSNMVVQRNKTNWQTKSIENILKMMLLRSIMVYVDSKKSNSNLSIRKSGRNYHKYPSIWLIQISLVITKNTTLPFLY